MIKGLLICVTFLFLYPTYGQKRTFEFARYNDSTILNMDVYAPKAGAIKPMPIILFVFGGGFFTGSKDAHAYQTYFHYLTDKGYTVAAIDYRLGMKGITKMPSLFNREPLINAIEMAVADTYAATVYLLHHATDLNIDTNCIILSGSSAGAITVLQCDYEKRNHFASAKVLPDSFEYAGVISCAGAIYSNKGKPKYETPPAPTLLFQGSKDNVVPYNKISLFGTGLFGSRCIASRYKKDGYPYTFYSFEGVDHHAAIFPFQEAPYLSVINQFIQDFILHKKVLFVDVNVKDPNRKNGPKVNLGEAMKRLNS
jgi:acetyl esterase/lipase